MDTRLLETDQISHTQSMVAKRDLTNVHTPMWKRRLKHSTAEFQMIHRHSDILMEVPFTLQKWPCPKNILPLSDLLFIFL